MARTNRIEPYTRIIVAIGVLVTIARILHKESDVLRSIQLSSSDQNTYQNVIKKSVPPSSYRLEFLHIPKNAGTMIESIALEKNITWGACHFNFPWKQRDDILHNCLPLQHSYKVVKPLWHWTLTELTNLKRLKKYTQPTNTMNPYDNLPLDIGSESYDIQMESTKPKKFFAVVRNPYYQYISLWRMRGNGKELDEWVHKFISGDKFGNSWSCQYDYIYDTSMGNELLAKIPLEKRIRVVDKDHTILFENLKEEFHALVNGKYGLNLTIPDETIDTNRNKRHIKYKLGPWNFTKATLDLLHDSCPFDFELGPYTMFHYGDDSKSYQALKFN